MPLGIGRRFPGINNHQVLSLKIVLEPWGSHQPIPLDGTGVHLDFSYVFNGFRNVMIRHDHMLVGADFIFQQILFRQKQIPVSVTLITGGILPCLALYIVGGGTFPGGKAVKIREGVFGVVFEQFRIYRYMANQHVAVSGIGGRSILIQTDFNILLILFIHIIGQAGGVCSRVAVGTIDIGLGVANLTLNLSGVNAVLPDGSF